MHSIASGVGASGVGTHVRQLTSSHGSVIGFHARMDCALGSENFGMGVSSHSKSTLGSAPDLDACNDDSTGSSTEDDSVTSCT